MGRTITLTDIKVVSWHVDLERECVHARYQILDNENNPFTYGDCIFWRTIPQVTNPPNNWYQLPENYALELMALTNDIRASLLHLLD